MNNHILIGLFWLMLEDDLNVLVPMYRSSLEGALYEMMAQENPPKAVNEYKQIALQYMADVILSTKDLPKPVVNLVTEIEKVILPEKSVWEIALEEIQHGKCND